MSLPRGIVTSTLFGKLCSSFVTKSGIWRLKVRNCFSNSLHISLFPLHSLPVPVEPITTTGEILAILSDRAFTVRLPNGKEVIGHPAKAMNPRKPELVVGVKVALEMTPFDFEKARIADIIPS
ncbi:UNVERIFIED_CONTAM: hypothetical protein GTU68_064487 [Idotea baltica]|nr:hypothetical protein [Idotea baltica]